MMYDNSWEADSGSENRDIPNVLWRLTFQHYELQSVPMDENLSHAAPG
jgi:hypothetical protein